MKKTEITFMPRAEPKRKTWSRKGKCPECGVSTGSKHSKGCALEFKLPDNSRRK